jgi:hypothetical protein
LGETYGNYFSSYSNIPTMDIFLNTGAVSDPQVCASLNRHVYNESSKIDNHDKYSKTSKANYCSWFWHEYSIDNFVIDFTMMIINTKNLIYHLIIHS